jgi:hypothetical protein
LSSLSSKYPILNVEFAYDLNSNASLDDFSEGSGKKVWWRCSKDERHVWPAAINKRAKYSRGCPYCSGRLASPGNNLLDCYPNIERELHSELNGDICSAEITPVSGKKLWWQCSNNPEHVYSSRVADRTYSGSGCPYCSGQKVDSSNSLEGKFPEVAKNWDFERNDRLTPSDITWGSNKKVWWICEKNPEHKFQSSIVSRTSGGSGCPICANTQVSEHNSLENKYPEIARSWHPTKNGEFSPSNVVAGGHKQIWWLCPYGHEWKTQIKHRINGSNCPKCSNQTSQLEIRVYCEIKALFENTSWREKVEGIEADVLLDSLKLIIEIDGSYWHKSKVKADKDKTLFFESKGYQVIRLREQPLEQLSHLDVCHKTNEDHKSILHALVLSIRRESNNKTTFTSCDNYIANDDYVANTEFNTMISMLPAPPKELSLLENNPRVAESWDYNKNHPLTPDMFYPSSNKVVYWNCELGHSWQKSIDAWNNVNSKCSTCSLKSNSLMHLYPELVKYWHPTKNGTLTADQVNKRSDKIAWWICDNGHEFKVSIAKRTSGRGCPYCAGKQVGEDNNLAVRFPTVAAQWHKTKNQQRTPIDYTYGSSKTVWWICELGHEYQMPIKRRTTQKNGCPYCNGKLVSKENSLAFNRPDLAEQWDSDKNSPLTPADITKQSGRVVWWSCEKGHSFKQRVIDRYSRISCPSCRKKRIPIR